MADRRDLDIPGDLQDVVMNDRFKKLFIYQAELIQQLVDTQIETNTKLDAQNTKLDSHEALLTHIRNGT